MDMSPLDAIADSVIAGEDSAAREHCSKALETGISAGRVLNEGLLSGMRVVGERFKAHEFFIPDVLLAAKAVKAGTQVIEPFLLQKDRKGKGCVVLGTVQGDLHDIGKNLTAILLKGSGFNVVDLGKDISPEIFVEAAEKNAADIIGMSALLTTTMPVMKTVIALVRGCGLWPKVKIIIGGAPVTRDYALSIGADGFAPDAMSAAEEINRMLLQRPHE
jgi:5-methyltetrahydrofolate--homocysteine methyltransferase